jgi:hypothetical protein
MMLLATIESSRAFLGMEGLDPTVALAVGGGLVVVIVATIVDAWRKAVQAKAREESRREIAAYVAEGSMTAEDAATLLGDRKGSCLKTAVKERIRAAVEKM